MSTPRIKVLTIRYQRNGVAGEGFHALTFRLDKRVLIAAVFEGRGRVAVMDPAKPRACWHGDWFEPELRAYIAAHDDEAFAPDPESGT